MPKMNREDWLRLSPKGKEIHHMQRNIDRLDELKARYERGRASGKIAETIPFLEL
jgi:hypothetical protein